MSTIKNSSIEASVTRAHVPNARLIALVYF